MVEFPKHWFFLDQKVKNFNKILHSVKSNNGVVLFNRDYHENNTYINETNALIDELKKRKITVLVSASLSKVIKYNACGIYLTLSNYFKNVRNKLDILSIPKGLMLATSVHNEKEIIQSNRLNYNLVFISPAFKTKSHLQIDPLKTIRFINLCKLPKGKVFALGGINEKNFQLLKNKHLMGFGAITHFYKSIGQT